MDRWWYRQIYERSEWCRWTERSELSQYRYNGCLLPRRNVRIPHTRHGIISVRRSDEQIPIKYLAEIKTRIIGWWQAIQYGVSTSRNVESLTSQCNSSICTCYFLASFISSRSISNYQIVQLANHTRICRWSCNHRTVREYQSDIFSKKSWYLVVLLRVWICRRWSDMHERIRRQERIAFL